MAPASRQKGIFMNMVHAVVLGALQGFSEVLPISSSAHLILIPWFLKWPESGLTFDVALHLGTLIALAAYFRRDIIQLVLGAVDALATRSLDSSAKRLPFLILAATVPAGIVGKLFEQTVEDVFRRETRPGFNFLPFSFQKAIVFFPGASGNPAVQHER